jgi:hypothetical protein
VLWWVLGAPLARTWLGLLVGGIVFLSELFGRFAVDHSKRRDLAHKLGAVLLCHGIGIRSFGLHVAWTFTGCESYREPLPLGCLVDTSLREYVGPSPRIRMSSPRAARRSSRAIFWQDKGIAHHLLIQSAAGMFSGHRTDPLPNSRPTPHEQGGMTTPPQWRPIMMRAWLKQLTKKWFGRGMPVQKRSHTG